jgi:hypothetical protein
MHSETFSTKLIRKAILLVKENERLEGLAIDVHRQIEKGLMGASNRAVLIDLDHENADRPLLQL